MKWNPSFRVGVLVGSGIILMILLVDGGLLWRVFRGPLNGATFVCAFLALLSLPTMLVIGYRIYDLVRLRYEFDRNRLVIISAAVKQIIPMSSIERVVDGRNCELKIRTRGLVWPGCFIGHGDIEGIGLTLFYGTVPPRKQMIIVTPTVAYGISMPNVETFAEVFDACRQLGTTVRLAQESLRSAYVHWSIWNDRVAQGVLLGSVVLCAMLFAVVCFRYPNLPNLLPMHYDVEGRVDRIAPRSEVFVQPVIGLITWTVNGAIGAVFYRRERMVAYLAWSGTLVVQVFFLLALWNIVK